jgi:DNA-binding SARP family transcriptional activator
VADFKLYLFGDLRFLSRDLVVTVSRRKAWALLAFLALEEQRQHRDTLAALLWPDLDQAHARAALRTTLSALVTEIPGPWFTAEQDLLALNPQALWIDVRAFQALLAQSRAHKHDNPALCGECRGWLHEAVDLYRADFLAGFTVQGGSAEFEHWQLTQREWLRREQSYALKRLATAYGALDDVEQAISVANHWVALDPLHEAAHRLLMHLYAASGRRAEALRQYQKCVDLLQSELATPPEDETTRLAQRIQADGKRNGASPVPTAQAAFHVLPARPPLLVGRAQALLEMKRRLGIDGDAHPITVIQGWPGVGKSTLVAALAHDPDIAARFPDGILWASLGKMPSIRGELMTWAQALGLVGAEGATTDALAARLIAFLKERAMLLIVDDVWHVEHFAPFRVGGAACAVVATSRLNDVAHALAPTALDLYRLPVLAEQDGLDLLGQLAPDTVADYPEEARALVRDLEGLPLALQVAGRLLHSEARLGWSITDLLLELRAGARLLQARAPSDLGVHAETSPTIAALLRRSTDALDPATRQRFALLSLFVPKPATFDLDAMAAAWDVADARETARLLVSRGLLEPIAGGRFQVHALLVVHARALLMSTVE